MSNFINVAYAHSGEVGSSFGDMHDFGMMGGAGSILWIVMYVAMLALVVLGVVALVKYVFGKDDNKHNK